VRHDALERTVDEAMLRLFARNYVRIWPHLLLLTLVLFAAATPWIPAQSLAPAFLIVVLAVVATSSASRRFLHEPPAAALRTWRSGFVLGEMVHGSGWVLFTLPFFAQAEGAPDPTAGSVVLISVLLVMVATAVLRAQIFGAVIAGIAPLGIAVLLAALRASSPEEWVLVLLTLGAQVFLAYVAWRLYRTTAAMIRARAEIQASFVELERAKASSGDEQRRAEEADRARQLFLATMSHELRTPLNAILGFSEVMKNEVLGSHSTPSYREYSSDIHGSGQHLLTLINEILDLSRLQAGQYELKEDWLQLDRVAAEAIAQAAPAAETKTITIRTALDTTLAPLRADPRALRQVAGHLLSNAIKFTPAGGHVTLKTGWTSRGGQYLTVSDDGPGIPAIEIPLVLSSFGRGSLAVSTAAQGLGLGLPIAKGLVGLHGGRLVLDSAPGFGTDATVILPATRVQPAPPDSAAPSPAGTESEAA
jgi:two-component system cell cycle sensor histidine kinase PleC